MTSTETGSPFLHRPDEISNDRHRALIVNTGEDALLLRSHFFHSARHAIKIQTFLWQHDYCGRYFAWLTLLAARRGVKVSILVDCWPSLKYPPLLVYLGTAHPNIELKFFNPPDHHIRPSPAAIIQEAAAGIEKINFRMHNKSFIVDDRILILGGRNYEDAYYDRGNTLNFRDREVLIEGAVAGRASEYFRRYWRSSYAFKPEELKDCEKQLRQVPYRKDASREDFKLGSSFDQIDGRAVDHSYLSRRFSDEYLPVEQASFICDAPEMHEGRVSESYEAFSRILRGATSEILMQTPYFVLDDRIQELFKELLARDLPPTLKVSTNSLACTDNLLAYASAVQDRKRFLKELDIRIFEFKPRPGDWGSLSGEPLASAKPDPSRYPYATHHLCIHAKTYIIDGTIAVISSSNIDPRSMYHNTEAGIVIRDAEFSQRLRSHLIRDLEPRNSWVVGFSRRGTVSCFDHRLGSTTPSFRDADFHRCYDDVGAYPLVERSPRRIKMILKGAIAPLIKRWI